MKEQESDSKQPNSDADHLLETAIQRANAGELDRAIQEVQGLFKRYPQWLEPRGHLAGMFIVRGRYDEALQQYDFALQHDPGNPYASSMAAWLCMERFDLYRAEAYLQQARLDDSPTSQSIREQQQTLQARIDQFRKWPRTSWMALILLWGAEFAWFWRARERAIQLLQCATATQERSPEILERLGCFLSKQQTYDFIAKHRTSAAFLNEAGKSEKNLRIHERLAEIAWCRGDDEEAISEARQVLESEPLSNDALHVLTLAQTRQGNRVDAATNYDKLITLSPSDIYLYLNRCGLSIQLRDYESAQRTLDRAKTLDANNPLLRFLQDMVSASAGSDFNPERTKPNNETNQTPPSISYGAPWLYGVGLAETKRKLKRNIKKLRRMATGTAHQFFSKHHFHRVPCDVCGSNKYDRLCICSGNGWRIVRCRSCGLVYTQPQPKPAFLYGIYQKDYWEGARSIGAEDFHQRSATQKIVQDVDIPLFRWLERIGFHTWAHELGPARRALDVGCGSGIFMRELLHEDWNVEGVEVAEDVVAFCQRMGLEVRRGTLHEAGYQDSEFDFATLHHVIEHVVDPAELVREVKRVLKPGGRFLVRTPCCDSLPAVLAGQDWFYDPDHIYFFSQASLRALLERNGFQILDVMSTVGVQYETWSQFWNTAHLNHAIREILENSNQGDVIVMLAESIKS